jgi:hypothetical protein
LPSPGVVERRQRSSGGGGGERQLENLIAVVVGGLDIVFLGASPVLERGEVFEEILVFWRGRGGGRNRRAFADQSGGDARNGQVGIRRRAKGDDHIIRHHVARFGNGERGLDGGELSRDRGRVDKGTAEAAA